MKYLYVILILAICKYARSEEDSGWGSPCCLGDNIMDSQKCISKLSPSDPNSPITMNCSHGMYAVDPVLDQTDEFTVEADGNLYFKTNSLAVHPESFCTSKRMLPDDKKKYPMTTADGKMYRIALICFTNDEQILESEVTYTVTGMMGITSVIFLVLTLVVYAVVPQLRDLQGKCIMCTCTSLALGFLHLSLAQLIIGRDSPICLATGFGIYFWMMATFVWLNIVSINVMRTVVFPNSKIPDKTVFTYYNLYGWGIPLILLLATYISHSADGSHMKPGFGDTSCWFSGRVETWSYFYAPITVILVVNILLFIFTSVKLSRRTSYENVTKLRSMKYKFCLYMKIFLVTGLSWIFEIISFAHDEKHIAWLIADTFNALQGVVYFLVLIAFRRRALRGLHKRGLPLPCNFKDNGEIDEECDEIIKEEEEPAFNIVRA